MITALEIIKSLAATASRTEKEQIIFNAYMTGHREFFIATRLAMDPLVSFGVAKAAKIEDDDSSPGTLTFDDFLVLVHRLRKRELTGHAARDAIMAAADRSHVETWNLFYRRVILKDLSVGVEAKTINKVLTKVAQAHPESKDYMIPVFMAQMAEDGRQHPHSKKLRGRKMCDLKLDGVRLLSVLDKSTNTVTQFTGRNGAVNEKFTEVREALFKLMQQMPGSVVLDGEIVAGSFQELMTMVNAKSDRDTSVARLALFDIIPLSDFKAGQCRTPQEDRHHVLAGLETSGMLKITTGGLVYVNPKTTVDLDTPEGQAEAVRLTNEAIAAGFDEAIMYKDPSAPYECGKRTTNWLKKKPSISVSLPIIGLEEGKDEGKNSGRTGALVCRGDDSSFPGLIIRVKVGTGLSDQQRIDFWADRDKLIGMIVEIEADGLSLEQGSTEYSLRFPRFKGFRGTVPGEKL